MVRCNEEPLTHLGLTGKVFDDDHHIDTIGRDVKFGEFEEGDAQVASVQSFRPALF